MNLRNVIPLISANRKNRFHAPFGEKKHIFIFTYVTVHRLEPYF